ncbi:MAG: hypothetical protein JXB34_04690 [Bacteroidales bacterium]|nr:hypothetical protein [Bacteroidales bacterium]
MNKQPYYLSILFLVSCMIFTAKLGAQSKKFFHLTSVEGLSQNTVYSFCQDYRGFMWIGTRDGLNKYDGYNITVYRNDPNDSCSISNSFIRVIFSDSKNRLWIGTSDGGLNLYNFEKNNFTRYFRNGKAQNNIPGNNISAIQEDKHGNLWIGTIDAGVFMFNPERNLVKSYQQSDSTANSISGNAIRALKIDSAGYVWLGFWSPDGLNRLDPATGEIVKYNTHNSGITSDFVREIHIDSQNMLWLGTDGGGLNTFDPVTGKVQIFKAINNSKNSISHNVVSRIIEGFDDEIWIGTENGGLNIYNRGTGSFSNYINLPTDFLSLSNNSVYALYKGENAIWVGTYSGGVDVYFRENNLFRHFKYNILDENSLSHNSVLCFTEDNAGNLWIGTDGGGLNKFDPKTNKFSHFRHCPNQYTITSDFIVSLLYTTDRKIWIGTWGGGLSLFDPDKNTFRNIFKHYPEEIRRKYKNCWTLAEDSQGLIWVGTYYGGLVALDKKGSIVHRFESGSDDKGLLQNDIAFITFDRDNNCLWIGTDANGLNRLNLDNFSFTQYRHNINNPNSLVNNNILCLFTDSRGFLWIGTNNGLSRLNKASGSFVNYTTENGFASDFITAIEEDSEGNLWISTKKGLSRLNLQSGKVQNFDISQGLQDYEFNRGASFADKNGQMFFGGIKGFNVFNPKEISEVTVNPPVFLTGFFIHNTPCSEHNINVHPNELKEVKLKHTQNYLTFEYASLAFSLSNKIEYYYKLSGVDSDWVSARKKRSATYTHIPPGTYEFWVRTIYDNQLQEPVKLISVTIVPPFWLTLPFMLTVMVAISFIIVYTVKYRERKLLRDKQNLEAIVKERTESIEKQKTELESLNKTKDKLFSIIAHDLRNPFNILLGFTELMYDRIGSWNNAKIAETIGLINASAQRIYNLLENLLAWARSQNSTIVFKPAKLKLLSVVTDNLDLFSTMLAAKKINLHCTIDNEFEIYADIDMLNTIIRNLISNAIKFSDINGLISISAYTSNIASILEVSDNGVGIPEEKAGSIFGNAFESTVGTDNEKGTGLGLYICHEFMDKHQGKIYYNSLPKQGTTFILEFPFPKEIVG